MTVRRDDGMVDGTGESYTMAWDMNDPRISGRASIVMNETGAHVILTARSRLAMPTK